MHQVNKALANTEPSTHGAKRTAAERAEGNDELPLVLMEIIELGTALHAVGTP